MQFHAHPHGGGATLTSCSSPARVQCKPACALRVIPLGNYIVIITSDPHASTRVPPAHVGRKLRALVLHPSADSSVCASSSWKASLREARSLGGGVGLLERRLAGAAPPVPSTIRPPGEWDLLPAAAAAALPAAFVGERLVESLLSSSTIAS